MAKKKPTPGKLAGKTVAFVGKFGHRGRDLEPMTKLVAAQGGSVVDGMQTAPDYLVTGAGVGGNPPATIAKVQKKHPQVQSIDEADFYRIVSPTGDEVREFMLSGPRDLHFWAEVLQPLQKSGTTLDLSSSDFRGCAIEGQLYHICLDGSDFRGAKISATFDRIKGARFDGATFEGGTLQNAEDCSLQNVTMNKTHCGNGTRLVRCDFSGARLRAVGGGVSITNCTFSKADLRDSQLDGSKFTLCDFTRANLSDSSLEKCQFTGANLAGVDFSRTNLRDSNFGNADLRKTRFNSANLSGVDLSGANVDGADFSGANLTGVNVTGVDLSKAKNLKPIAAHMPGPNMHQLAKLAQGVKRFKTSIELVLDADDDYVILEPTLNSYGNRSFVAGHYNHRQFGSSFGSSVGAPTFEQCMLKLTDLWSRGSPRFESVKVDAKECPMRGKELRDLAVAAWHEACGLAAPTAQEPEKAVEQRATENATLRECMIAELVGGLAGVAKWNARSDRERSKLGKLRKHNLANAKLCHVNLDRQNLEGSCFDGANLKEANFHNAQLKRTSFVKAKLADANLAGAKCADASFQGAELVKCNLRAASFLRCNFQNANLAKADFSFSDLSGADFTKATLDGVEFFRTEFDEKSIFPPSFVAPEGLEWKGAGPRPGTAPPPPPPKSGTLDFDAFLVQLNNKVEAARMQKAGSMLKAERFQLFADVKDDHLVGVVKSQTNQELVYSCRLASNGAFGCCTQNLRPCGGLRGALCKHLLVLIVGLAKAGKLDSATVDHWIDLSRSQKPAIDEDAMSATFLRYKGAEAGEVDWRPTETIPEDFYAM